MADPATLYAQLTGAGEPYRIATYIIVIFITLAGFAMGLGRAFGVRKLEEWGKHEILQQVINAAFIAGLASVTLFIMMLVSSLTPQPGSPEALFVNPDKVFSGNAAINFSLHYLDFVNSICNALLAGLSVIYAVLAPLSTLNVGVNLVVTGSITPLNGLTPFLELLGTLISAMAFFIFMIFAQRSLLLFVDATAFAVFLPLGLILRSAYVTRKVGGALIAISIGLYVVYPLLFVLDVTSMRTVVDGSVMNATLALDSAKGSITSAGIGVSSADPANMSVDYGGLLSQNIDIASKLVNGIGGVMSASNSLVVEMQRVFASFFIVLFFMPFFNIIITIISIKEMAQLFGSEINAGGVAGLA